MVALKKRSGGQEVGNCTEMVVSGEFDDSRPPRLDRKYLPLSSRMIGLPAGIIGFILAKRQVDKNRLKQLKIRQRMRRSNEGEYDGSRYRQHAKLDR